MGKAQMVAVFLAGSAVGIGGAKLSVSNPNAPQIRVHALDLRAGAQLADGGYEVSRHAYGTLVRPDGGTKDIGAARRCATPSEARQAALADEVRAAAVDCEWDF